jgi:hypothetical protein
MPPGAAGRCGWMMLDYKDVSFSFRDRKIRRRRRRLRWLLLAFFALAAFLGYSGLKARAVVDDIQDLLLAGRLDEAEQRLQTAGSPFFQRGNFRELRALNELFHGRLEASAAQLDGLRRDRASTALRSGQMLKYFFDRGRSRELKVYTDYLLPRMNDEVRWFHALYQAAFLDPRSSEKAVAGLSASFRKANGKALDLLSGFNRSLKSGRIDYIFDRNELPLAYYDLRRRATRALVPGMDFAAFEAQFKNGFRRFRLTLDRELQKKVELLFRDYYGTLVLLDLPESSIAVAYSKPRSSGVPNAAWMEQFEPGSIVKVISLLAYLRSPGKGIFPLDCPGLLAVDGKIIYDLEKHGRVKDISQALARSCNVSFARMGWAAGFTALSDLLQRFFFNAPPFSDQFCSFATGRFDTRASDDFRLARLAAGLDGVSLTTVHAAVLAAVFSQAGQFFPPYLIDDAKNILGLGFYRHESRPRRLLADDLNFLRVKKAMAAVVEDEKGTGRRARSQTVRLAIKTGTAGSRSGGLDAVIIGFFPFEKPRYAFAFRLEGGGRSEINGALFLQGLLHILVPE